MLKILQFGCLTFSGCLLSCILSVNILINVCFRYDYDRSSFTYVRALKETGVRLTFRHQHDFDENGIIYWIGTNAK